MMRTVAAALTGIFMVLYIMYIFIPLLSTTKTNFAPLINASDPTIITSNNLGQGFYFIGPLAPILVAVFVIISVALKRSPDE